MVAEVTVVVVPVPIPGGTAIIRIAEAKLSFLIFAPALDRVVIIQGARMTAAHTNLSDEAIE